MRWLHPIGAKFLSYTRRRVEKEQQQRWSGGSRRIAEQPGTLPTQNEPFLETSA
jgi:hypothetical protein